MAKYFKADTALGMEAECAVCYCIWTDPLEILPCQHIFCKACIASLDTCPTCCGPVAKTRPPNNALLRMLQRTRGSCSCCAWSGTLHEFNENHRECWKDGQPGVTQQASSGQYNLQTTSSGAMDDYFMENTLPVESSPPTGASRQRTQTASSDAQPSLSSWKMKQQGLASQYGLFEDEYEALMEKFYVMATGKSNDGEPALTWRDACRLLRFFNYPNHPDDVRDLFVTCGQSTEGGRVSFHALCTWIPLNRRSVQQWYGMPDDAYKDILMMALVLDESSTGLFTLDQARLLAEQYFERDVPNSEWAVIEPMVKERALALRQGFPDVVADQAAISNQELKLPFHDVLLSFMRYVDMMKKRQFEDHSRRAPGAGAALQPNPLTIQQRIRNLVAYYDPSALPNLDSILGNFQGEEESLLMTFTAMYGPERPV